MFKVLYQDKDYIIINKPSGILTHPSEMSRREISIMPTLRDQLGKWVYPVHRLDPATSGVMIWALSSESAKPLAQQFSERKVDKTYQAIVRDYTNKEGIIDYKLKKEGHGEKQEAISHYKTLGKLELDISDGRHPTSRHSLVEVKPRTGRMHQIRRHMAHIAHPIIGDTTYGVGRHNRIFKDK